MDFKSQNALNQKLKEKEPSKQLTNAYVICLCTFCMLIIACNTVGVKISCLPFFPQFAITTGILIYPFSFVLSDLVTEIWGTKASRFMVVLSFFMSLVVVLLTELSIYLPYHPDWATTKDFGYRTALELQQAYVSVFGLSKYALFGSLCGYLIAQMIDIHLFSWLKTLTQGKQLWLRNNASTIVSQAVDTVVVSYLILIVGFGLSWKSTLQIMVVNFVLKIIFSLIFTPVLYALKYLILKPSSRQVGQH